MNIKLNSKLDRKGVVRIGKMAETWCRQHMGLNNRKKLELLVSYKQGDDASLVGEYDPQEHEIIIYWDNIDNVKELLQTMIHEWTHSLQPLSSKWSEYNAQVYSRNRFEKEAYDNEKRYTEMWIAIKSKINKI
jgi:hypothetical protein